MTRPSWCKRRIGDLLRIKHGYAFKGEYFSDDGPYILLTPGNFYEEGGFKKKGDKEKYYTGTVPESFILARGDLLIAMTEQAEGLLGSSAIVPQSGRYLHNQRLGLVTGLNEDAVDKKFLYYLFNTWSVRSHIRASASGVKVRHTSPSRIYEVEVEMPPLPTQRKIAAILSAYDDLIENNARRIAILEEMARLLYREWFVHFRFPGYEEVTMVDSPLGPIPEGWGVKQLEDVCNLVVGQSPKSKFYNEEGDGLPFHQGVSDFGDLFPITRRYCIVTKRIAEEGDILFSVRAPVGRMNIANRRIVIGRGLHAIQSKTGDQTFVFLQLKDRFYEEDMMGGGTIFKSVTKADMLGLELLIPSTDMMAQFDQIVNPIFSVLKVLTAKNANLRRTRDLLLPCLISGEVDVSDLNL